MINIYDDDHMLAGVDPHILVQRHGSIPPEGHLLPLPSSTALSHHLVPIPGLNIYSTATFTPTRVKTNVLVKNTYLAFFVVPNLMDYDTGISVSQLHLVFAESHSGISVMVPIK